MDVELEAVGGSTTALHCDVVSHIGNNEKPTPWTNFVGALARNRGVVLFFFLAILCISVGSAVYFTTLRDENYILCCKEWINIHLIPHSHDDVGWLRTPEHYYEYTVRYILNNVIHELERNPDRKFVYVETYFFWRWWNQQSPETQSLVRRLLDAGQFEFAGGGWTMNDEAVANYLSIIDQFTWGLRRLNDTFGEIARPLIGWQIDTFGHSREMVSLLSLMGFTGVFFARIDEEERSQRRDKQSMEFYWEDRDGASRILTSIMYKHYNPPHGFHYEKENNEGANLDKFIHLVREQASAYRTRNVLIPMGDDFTYYDARAWYENMDALIAEVHDRNKYGLNVNMFYSTPSQYMKFIRESNEEHPVKDGGDFFPYGSDLFSYWTGYYTSRPTLKFFERTISNYLQVLKQLAAMSRVISDADDSLISLRESLYTLTHHDAITGTAKQGVTDHYVDLIYRSFISSWSAASKALNTLTGSLGSHPLEFDHCLLLNISQCAVSEQSEQFIVTVYNSLSWSVSRNVRLPVLAAYYFVRSYDGQILPSQVIPLPDEVQDIPGRSSRALKELIFNTNEIPPLGFKSFYIASHSTPVYTNSMFSYSTDNIRLSFDTYNGHLSELSKDGHNFPVEQDLEFYHGSPFWTGAYIFRPADKYPIDMEGPAETRLVSQGPVVDEYQQTLGPWSSQVLRVYKNSPYLEIEWLVGPIPVEDYQGKEVVARYTSKIESHGVYFTDTNGRGSLRRRRNKRDDWRYSANEEISGNYYPINLYISVRDNSSQMFVIIDRPQGGTSIYDGQVELMVHRRLCYDDGKGVNEPLNETAYDEGLVVRGRHWLLIDSADEQMEQKAKRLGLELQNEPFLFLASTKLSYDEWSSSYINFFNGLSHQFPSNVRILTLEPWVDGLLLLRLEHIFEKFPANNATLPVTVKLKGLFKMFDVVGARETALGADRWLRPEEDWLTGEIPIILQPTAIRTFLIKILPKYF